MLCTRCLRCSLSLSSRPRISIVKQSLSTLLPRQSQHKTASAPRQFSILSTHRPRVLNITSNTPNPTTSTLPPTSELDILPKISTHPSLAGTQVRNGPRNTFNPSHRVRKRRHGFLSRVKTRKGRNTISRRRAKGRANLSH